MVKHQKHSNFAITDIREKPVNFFLLFNTGVNVGLRNNFANSGFFAKVSFLFISIIPWIDLTNVRSYPLPISVDWLSWQVQSTLNAEI